MKIEFEHLQLPVAAEQIQPIQGGYLLSGSNVALLHPFGYTQYYRHGYHSWSLSAWLPLDRPLPRPALEHLWPHCDDPDLMPDYPFSGSAVGALQGPDDNILLLGALHLGARVQADPQVLRGAYDLQEIPPTADPERDSQEFEWFLAYGAEQQAFDRYAELLKQRLGSRDSGRAPRVWCSWYGLYTDIREDLLVEALQGLRGMPFEVFQVDDGWQQDIGDWEANAKFPSGMTALADNIRRSGFTPGLWLAPFIVQPDSHLFQQHPEWIVRDALGKPLLAGENWGGDFYALDLTHPQVQEWLVETIQKIRTWGFDYLKLDFLYAASLPGKRYQPWPRRSIFRHGLRLVREAAGEQAYLLTCGAPVLASIGLADGMRIGPDVAPYWDNPDRSRYLHDFTGPAAVNAIRTSLQRLWLQPLIHTDPDVVFFRERYNLLTPQERSYLRDLAFLAGFKATSDLPLWLDEGERRALKVFLEADPHIERLDRYRFRIDQQIVDFGFSQKL
ncbi:MAG: alpha-galactosidase [Anaerolineales bacterium]